MTVPAPGCFVARIQSRVQEALDIVSFELVSADGSPLPPFTAGSHIDLYLDLGMARQYSLLNDPNETHRYRIAVLKEPTSRGGSAAIHGRLHEGDLVKVGGPRNHFALASGPSPVLLLAGGIGVTPILSMAEQLWRDEHEFTMHYCTRSVERTAFRAHIASAGYATRVHLHVDDAGPEQRMDIARVIAAAAPETHVYVCGPRGFMNAVLETARSAGWQESRLHYEYFAGTGGPSTGDRSFHLELARSARTIPVAHDQTVVQALVAHGIEVETSCEQGVCGTCLTRVVAGVPEHRDSYLTQEERASCEVFMPCCSRAKTPVLVLDL